MLNRGHPVHFLRSPLLDICPNLVLEFSKYIHLGYGRTLSREILHIQAKHVTEDWVEDQIFSLSEEQELALHSRVKCGAKFFHIPMVDFIYISSLEQTKPEIQLINKQLSQDICFFKSGQSLHGYYLCLIDNRQWFRYLGSLLLCNPPKAREIVDSRWVGHSLQHGFSALRWSCNSTIYKLEPEFI